jgi:L-alanine-DL-glutamate epimerase-like enolase superfamily enzyme
MAPIKLEASVQKFPLLVPFHITGYVWEFAEVLQVTLTTDNHVGQGEASGVYYRKESPTTMLGQIESLRTQIEAGVDRDAVQHLLPPGGARNALDCALWDLEAKLGGLPAWQIAALEAPEPVLTTFTCGADTPEKMAAVARNYKKARALKLKLTGDSSDSDRVSAVRHERPDVWLGVDANQGFTRASLEALMPVLIEKRVSLIEQPFPVGHEGLLDGLRSPIPVAADESAQTSTDLAQLAGRFQVVNIKLDKCGGLTEGLAMARSASRHGLQAMVGSMMGSSLAMAPAFLVAQLCEIVDLDAPVVLKSDRETTVEYLDGLVTCPSNLWGYP